jgi:hypothetical protein
VKLAVIIPVGFVDRHGYQRHLYECVGSFAGFDRLYLAESLRVAPGLAELAQATGATIVEDEACRFEITPDGAERYDYGQVNALRNVALDRARADGCDAVFEAACNWYAPPDVVVNIRLNAEVMLAADLPWAWLYWRYQLAGQLYHTGDRAPWLVNLHYGYQYTPQDWLVGPDGGRTAGYEHGDWVARDNVALIDCPLEMTLDELRDKSNRVRCYQDLVPKRNPVFDWNYWRAYYVRRFGPAMKTFSDEALQGVGRIVAARSQPDFISQIVLREMGL